MIWHNADEEPQENAKIVWYATGDCIKMCTHIKGMVHGGMTKWAYAEELLNLKTQETIEDLPKIKGWIARDKTYELNFFSKKPKRNIADSRIVLDNVWIGKKLLVLDCDLYPNLTWEDEPIEAEIILKVASDALSEECIREKDE